MPDNSHVTLTLEPVERDVPYLGERVRSWFDGYIQRECDNHVAEGNDRPVVERDNDRSITIVALEENDGFQLRISVASREAGSNPRSTIRLELTAVLAAEDVPTDPTEFREFRAEGQQELLNSLDEMIQEMTSDFSAPAPDLDAAAKITEQLRKRRPDMGLGD